MLLKENDNNSGRSISISYIYHIPEHDEGSRIKVTFYQDSEIVKISEFGWTNSTLHRFVEMLKNFPVEQYDGYFSHYEKQFEVRWTYASEPDIYTLKFDDMNFIFDVRTSQQQIRKFGEFLEKELKDAPSYESYKRKQQG